MSPSTSQLGEVLEHLFHHDARLKPGQCMAQAIVGAETECELVGELSPHVVAIRVGEPRLVVVRREHDQRQATPGWNRPVVQLDVTGHVTGDLAEGPSRRSDSSTHRVRDQ